MRIDAVIGRYERTLLKPGAWESSFLVKAIAHARGGDLQAAEEALKSAELPTGSRIIRSLDDVTLRPLTAAELRGLFQRFLLDEQSPSA